MAENAVLVTTETERGKRELLAEKVFFGLAGLVFVGLAVFLGFAPDSLFSQPNDLLVRIFFVLFFGVFGVLALVQPHYALRGYWRLDDDGITFTPLRGNPRRLAWSDVEAIYWWSARYRVIFRSGKTKLPVILQWETRERQDEFKDFLQEKLGNSFDLSIRPEGPLSIRRLCWISVATTFFGLLWFGGLILQSYYLDQFQLWRKFGILWFIVPLFLLLWWGANIALNEHRKRWRLRKSS